MPAIGSVNVKVSATTGGLTSGLTSATSSLNTFSSKIQGVASNSLGSLGAGLKSTATSVTSLTSGLGGLALKAGLVGGAFIALRSAYSAFSGGIKGAADMEQAEIAFGVLFKSTDTAKTVLGDLSKFAADTPFELPELTGAARSLAAFGTEASNIVPTMKMIGDVSSGVSAPIGEIAELYGKAKVQGRLFGEDINQLTGRGIPIIGELAKQFGVSESQVKKLVEEGKVGFPQLEKAFQSMTGAGGQFEGLMAKQSKSYAGMWSTLSDNVGSTFRDISSSLLEAFDVKSIMSNLIGFTDTVKAGVQSIVPIIQSVASVFSSAWNVIAVGANAMFGGLVSRVPMTFETIVASVQEAGAWITSTFEAIKPIVAATGAFIAASWAAIGSGALWLFNSVYEIASGWFTNISTIFSNLTGVTGVTFESIKLFMIDALLLGEFLFDNFAAVSALAFEKTKLAAVTMFADIGHFFTGVIPTWFNWFSENWQDVFFTAFDLATTVFINLGTNIRKMFSSLWDYIKGGFQGSFEIDWTDLKRGAVNTIKSLPDIPERAVTELEKKLNNNVSKMGTKLGQKLGDHMIKGREELLGKPPEIPQRPAVTGTEIATGPAGMASATPAAVAKKPVEGVAALNRGSSGATSAILKAQRNDQGTAKAQLKAATQANKYLATIAERPQVEIVAGEV